MNLQALFVCLFITKQSTFTWQMNEQNAKMFGVMQFTEDTVNSWQFMDLRQCEEFIERKLILLKFCLYPQSGYSKLPLWIDDDGSNSWSFMAYIARVTLVNYFVQTNNFKTHKYRRPRFWIKVFKYCCDRHHDHGQKLATCGSCPLVCF